MDSVSVAGFLKSRCRALDRRGKSLMREVLLRLPDDLDLSYLTFVGQVYCGTAHFYKGEGWLIFLDWNVLHRGVHNKSGRVSKNFADAAKGVIALNIAHYALRHLPDKIHTKSSFNEAKKLARKWGFKREISAMVRRYL